MEMCVDMYSMRSSSQRHWLFIKCRCLLLFLFFSVVTAPGFSMDEKEEILLLKQQVSSQQQQIDELKAMVGLLLGEKTLMEDEASLVESNVHEKKEQRSEPIVSVDTEILRRDPVGDMRKGSVRRGEFPLAVEVVGRYDLPLSVAVGGFVKTVGFYDSDYERDDPYFLPALLGLGSVDQDGQFGLSSELSRIYMDGRTNTGKGDLRGYIEFDFRDDFTLRHAYFDWTGRQGQLKVGRYWSNFMDLGALPEGVTEPLVSGAAFARQEQVRYTSPNLNGVSLSLSVEDPSSNDVLTDENPLTHTPDIVGGARWNLGDGNHLRLGAIYRDIELKDDNLEDNSTTGWGSQVSGRWTVSESDVLLAGFTYGDGIGRYMLGLDPFSGGYIDTDGTDLKSRKAQGWFASYQRRLTDDLRANFMYGMARADDGPDLPSYTFEKSQYAAANVFYEITPYLVVSGEYTWGERENIDGIDLDNHRITFGFQLY